MTRGQQFLLANVCVVVLVGVLAGAALADKPPAPLTDVERLQIENLALKQQVIQATFRADTCAGQLAPFHLAQNTTALQTEVDATKARLEAARPGFTWNWQTFQPKVPDGR